MKIKRITKIIYDFNHDLDLPDHEKIYLYINSLHTHPIMEYKLNVPKDHVIIDREIFEKLKSLDINKNEN